MGLDMYMYRASKIGAKLKEKYNYNDTLKILMKYDCLNEIPDFLKGIASETIATYAYYDIKKLSKEYNRKMTLTERGYNPDYITVSGDDGFEITIREPELSEKYTYQKEEHIYVFEKEEVAYWRKANMIRNWLVEHIDNFSYNDNCEKYECTEELLTDLLRTCEKVKMNHDLAQKLLPTQGGFFFGSIKYDEEYYVDIDETISKISSILNTTDFDNEVVFYTEWW